MNLSELLHWGVQELYKANIQTALLDAEVLLSYVLKRDRAQLYLNMQDIASEKELHYRALIRKRIARTPVSYLMGHKEFMSLDFIVNEDVLIPRPDTETLVETVCRMGKPYSYVLDLGTGSGAIAVSLAKYNPDWRIIATDLSFKALLVARENAKLNGVMDRISFLQIDLLDALSYRGKFDWVLSNPPYIPTEELSKLPDEISKYEPNLALDGGPDGLDIIRRILSKAYKLLKPDGRLAIEMGYNQSGKIEAIADEVKAYSNYSIIKDYSGIPRVFCCQLKQK